MVSNEEIKRKLELKRKGINPDEESHLNENVVRTPPRSEPSNKKTIPCSKCGAMNLESSKFCIGCGNPLKKEVKVEVKSNTIVCPECGTENAETSRFCIGCGKNLKESPEEEVIEESFEVEEEPVSDGKPIQDNDVEADLDNIDTPESKNEDLFEEIKKAKELLDMGAITEEEFEKIKANYLKQFE